ncbi:MAG: Crp/Fnr family transcriptional regulator [Sulfurimonas sp.]
MNNLINDFLKVLNNITPISESEQQKLKNISNIKKIKQGDYFLRQGDKSSEIAFICEGLFRITYLTEDGKEFTKSFFDEQSFLVSYSALLENRESYFSIEALEDSTIVVIDYNEWKAFFENEISWNKLLVVILQKAFCNKESREREFLVYDAKTRYLSFIQTYPKLSKRLKQHVIASYLGITPEALSTIKKRLKLNLD